MSIIHSSGRGNAYISSLLQLSAPIPTTQSDSFLNAVEMLAQHALSAIAHLENKELSFFDPCVGDEACQIRALMVLRFAQQEPSLHESRNGLEAFIRKIEEARVTIQGLNTEHEKQKDTSRDILEAIRAERKAKSQEYRKMASTMDKKSPEHKNLMNKLQLEVRLIRLEEENQIKSAENEHRKTTDEKIQGLLGELKIVDIHFPQELSSLILCHLVTLVKAPSADTGEKFTPGLYSIRDAIQLRQLELQGKKLSNETLEGIISNAKKMINQRSVEFMQGESLHVTGKRAAMLQKIMASPLKVAKEAFLEISFYHTVELIMKRAKALQLPIVVKSRAPKGICTKTHQYKYTCKELFRVDPKTNKYAPSNEYNPESVALVIDGVSQLAGVTETLADQIRAGGGLSKMVKLNAAQHGFCKKDRKGDVAFISHLIDRDEQQKLTQRKTQAIEKGFSAQNFARFMIEHIYADKLSAQIGSA